MVSSETATKTGAVIIEAVSVTKTFTTPDGHALPVLEGVSFTLSEGEIVALGLEARGVADAERSERALNAIDLIGLDGFESAYPKELSGGMRQRVGFARAIVTEPDALLMDEPFSALDVLTAENLRTELVKLWEGHGAPVKSILIVTHNIEEAVLLADRVLVLSSNPGRIQAELDVGLPRPRDRHSPRFEALVDAIYDILTGREQAAVAALEAEAEHA